jgi:glycosyltransferase involved in cell wall biosynthesis
MDSTPDVTVVIPTRNRWHLLSRHALPSALGQQGVTVEAIVVDDGSTDGTADRVVALDDPRIRLVQDGGSRGPAAARNAGVAEARAEWVAFLDDDDLWAPDKLALQLAALGDADWGYTGAVVVDDSLVPTDELPLASPVGLADRLRHGNVLTGGGSAVVVRRAVFRELGGFDESLYYVEDWDLWRRLAEHGPAAVREEVLVATLDHEQRALFNHADAVLASIDALLTAHGATRDDRRTALEWLANQHARVGRQGAAARLYARAAIAYRSPGNLVAAAGALFGARGLHTASKLLTRVRGGSHLDLDRHPPAVAPAWLESFRA